MNDYQKLLSSYVAQNNELQVRGPICSVSTLNSESTTQSARGYICISDNISTRCYGSSCISYLHT